MSIGDRIKLARKRMSMSQDLLAKGYANTQIAETLEIAEGTVKNHIVNIYQKLGVHSRAEAVAWIWQHEGNQ